MWKIETIAALYFHKFSKVKVAGDESYFSCYRSSSPNVSLYGVFKSMNWNFGELCCLSKL
jgi:hypothetical protein